MIVAGTGHRPNKLGGYGKEAATKVVDTAVDWLAINRPTKVISGGALGWDQALAAAASIVEIPYVMALPFFNLGAKWPKESAAYLDYLCEGAADVIFVCEPGYAPWKMQKRNEWMVDNCDTVLALWNGTSGGTANCVAYAEKMGKPIINLWENYNDVSN